jgi:hypothetical protein
MNRTAMPTSRRSLSSSARICAWIVTSRAVVGLVGDQQQRVARQRHGDHHALAHPAGQLMRVVGETLLRGGDFHQLEQVPCTLHRRVAIGAEVNLRRLGDLAADRQDGIEARHGLLEDHRDVAPAQPAQRSRGQPGEVTIVPSRARNRISPPTTRPGGVDDEPP